MGYSRSIEDLVLRLKGGVFFLSPRERLFLKVLEEMGIPEQVVKEGIERCYTALNPRRRSKHPLFLCYRSVMEVYENFMRLQAQRVEIDWRERFRRKLAPVRDLIEGDIREPGSEEEAQGILKDIENRLVRRLWRELSPEDKRRIKEKYREFKENRELFSELIKREIQSMFGIPPLSLYVD
ncbi:hypothetical protein [Hydrogenivirga sp.]